jgi:gamma-glutamyltranspeptidase/glutathione hydrolase
MLQIARMRPIYCGAMLSAARLQSKPLCRLRAQVPVTPRNSRARALLAAITLVLISANPLVAGEHAASVAVTGSAGAVAAEHIEASRAGVEVLDAGGNAVDAAVAALLAIGVVNPSSSGLGGGGFMVVFDAEDGTASTIDFRETAPSSARRDMFVTATGVDSKASKRGGMAVGVPGEAAGFAMALERFGRIDRKVVVAPAIRLAKDGFTVEPHLAAALARHRDALASDPALANEFLRDDGTPYEAGGKLVRPDLARTLEAFAEHGAEPFLSGEIGREIAAAVVAAGGSMNGADVAGYRPLQRPAVELRFKHWTVMGMAPPSSGGGVIGEVLGVLEPYDLNALRHNSVTWMHLLAESLKAAFADRATFYGDPDFYPVPLPRLLSPEHAVWVRSRIRASRASSPRTWGKIAGSADSGTSHVSVIDIEGNAVACTSSINTGFGAKVGVPGRGIVLNNTMDDFSLQPGVPNAYGLLGSEANSIAPGKRPLSSMSPTVVLEDGSARLAVGASGGPLIITGTLQTMLNSLIFSMDVGEAISAPRIHNQWMPDMLGVEEAVPEISRTALERLGHPVRVFNRGAAVQAVEVIRKNGNRRVRAASDGRKGGLAAAQRRDH